MDNKLLAQQIEEMELELLEKKKQIRELRQKLEGEEVPNYTFLTSSREKVTLLELFGDKTELFVVHNMGRHCNYCTLWADGLNSIYHHISAKAAFVLSSPDSPEVQDDLAAERSWIFPMISIQGSSFTRDMGFLPDGHYYPGVSVFTRDQSQIRRFTKTYFGPGDEYCSLWSLFDLLPSGAEGFEPSSRLNTSTSFQLTNNIAVQVQDLPRAMEFYQHTLGFKLGERKEGEARLSHGYLNLYMEESQGNSTFFEFAVEDAAAARDTLLDKGCRVTKVYNEKSFMVEDPFGLKFHVFQVSK